MIPNIGGPELIILLAIVLLLFGAKKIPELAKGLGSGVREFRKGTSGDDEVEGEKKADDQRKEDEEVLNAENDAATAQAEQDAGSENGDSGNGDFQNEDSSAREKTEQEQSR